MGKYSLYNETFQQLDEYLTALGDYWQFEAFHHNDYPWSLTNPALSAFLDGLTEQELHRYQQEPEKLFTQLLPFIEQLRSLKDPLFSVKRLNADKQEYPFWLSNGIKGRKWSQITSFANQIHHQHPVIEWCAGKGHLGRVINWQKKLPITSIEWQSALCEQGKTEANKMQIEQRFVQADVLKGEADSYIEKHNHAVALHACGDLHLRLISLAKKHQPARLSISPCCYHLTAESHYSACSTTGNKSSLKISKQLLKLAVSKRVTTGERQSRLSEKEVCWRLAFDELQKSASNTEQYCPLPSFPKVLLSGPFHVFVEWAVQKKSLHFNLPDNFQPYLDLATSRLNKIRRMELISQFFVRPLELWLVYDRVLSLQESGYEVNLSTFCDEQITPRNLLIQAEFIGSEDD